MNSHWWQVTFRTVPDQVDALATMVVTSTGQGAEELERGVLRTSVPSAAASTTLVSDVARHFPDIVATVEEIAPVDWTTHWRDGIVARRFGRLVLSPSWLAPDVQPDDVLLVIDPESAFGSGEHGSTRGALTLLERHVHAGDAVLDLGSGSGILAIAAVLLGARSAIGVEVDDESNPIAEDNARRNLADDVTFLTGDAGELAPLAGPAALICSNILRSVNTLLLPSILQALAPGGLIIFAGMEQPEAALFAPVLAQHGLVVVDEVIDAGWWSVAVRRG